MVTLLSCCFDGGPPDKSKDQDEPDEKRAHPQQAVHDDRPGIPGLQRITQRDNKEQPHSEQEVTKTEPTRGREDAVRLPELTWTWTEHDEKAIEIVFVF